MSDTEVEDCDLGDCCPLPFVRKKKTPKIYQWEQKVLEKLVMTNHAVTHGVIISYSDGELRAVSPRNFKPDEKVLKNITMALKGDPAALAVTHVSLGPGTNAHSPGKIYEGHAIFGADGLGGGCIIFQSKVCVLIILYNKNPVKITTLASEVSEYMAREGH